MMGVDSLEDFNFFVHYLRQKLMLNFKRSLTAGGELTKICLCYTKRRLKGSINGFKFLTEVVFTHSKFI